MTYGVFTDEFEKTWQAHFLNKTTKELSSAIDIINTSLNESIEFLKKSIILNKFNKNSSKILKEENYRELNFIYHILYGSSRLLKRPSNRKTITEQ